jgi:hypothetical protein
LLGYGPAEDSAEQMKNRILRHAVPFLEGHEVQVIGSCGPDGNGPRLACFPGAAEFVSTALSLMMR